MTTTSPTRDHSAGPPAAVRTEGVGTLHPLLAERHGSCAFDGSATVTPDELGLLLDAARWAPSASNSQPWRFLVGRRGDRVFATLLAALTPTNRAWARDAAALVLVAAEVEDTDGTPRPWATYDAGQAVGHLTAQAAACGLAVRQMGGFLPADLPALPAHVTPLVVAAVGAPLPPAAVPADHPARRAGVRARRPLDEVLLPVA